MASSPPQTHPVRAWTYTAGYPSTLHLSTTHVPHESRVSPNHVLVRIAAAALNPVDIQTMNLPHWRYPALLGGDTSEKTTAMDFSGTVLAAGEGAHFRAGDAVFGMALQPYRPGGGALSEIAHLDLATTPCVTKPTGWSFETAAAISLVWLTAKACVEAVAGWVERTPGKRVAVLGGSSATGMYIVLLAKRRGWTVVATSSERNRDFVLGTLGADEHVDYTAQDVRMAVGEFHPDAVIDCVGGTECIGLLSSKRYITIVGDKTGRTMMGGPYTYYDLWHPLVAAWQWMRWARGKYGWGESYDVVILSPKTEWLEEAKETLSEDQVHIDSVHTFEDARNAFERLNTGRAKGKVIIDVASKL